MNYLNIYTRIIENRRNNVPTGYYETHHILPRCLGGTDSKDNLVKLTAKEHFICHLLLTKMYPKGSTEYYKTCHAFLMMLVSSSKNQRYVTARRYETLRTAYSVRVSTLQAGQGNSQFGTRWVYNPEEQQNKKIRSCDTVPTGWIEGRIGNWERYFSQRDKETRRASALAEKANRVSKHKEKQLALEKLDWEFMYLLYQQYGFDITAQLTNYALSRAALLMQFKKRIPAEMFVPTPGKRKFR